MITVLRAAGLEFAIYTADHPPPHVHVYGDGKAKIVLAGRDGRPELLWVTGLKDGDIRKAMKAVADHRDELLELWREIHG